ncbi:MAG: hypothetical protein ABJN34_11470 [Litoreibacter sp.]|uniref:hypothetical protein n=1 Tax=Litoreibacter sp. TaxID=1969459 RepID=UPI003297F401
MLALLLRHYRRFAMFSGGLALFGIAELSILEFEISTIGYIGLFVGALVISTIVGLGIYKTVPRYRGFLEISGMSAILTAAALFYLGKFGEMGTFFAICAIALLGALTALIWKGLHGRYAHKIGTETTWRDRYSGHIPYPARLVWRHVVPGAAEPSDHCTGMMARYDEDDEDEDTVHVTFKGRKDRAAVYALTFLERDHPSSCRFFFQGTEADGTFVDGTFSLQTTTLDRDSCFISCVEERAGMSIGRLLERWFDDALGYQHDRLLEILEKRYGDTYGPNKSTMMSAE